MIRNLTVLTRKLPASMSRPGRRGATAIFWLGVFALMLQFVLPYVVLDKLGIPSQRVKVHPATVLVLIGAICALASNIKPFAKRCRESPGLMLFVFAIPLLAIYSIIFVGYSGSAVYPDSFWSAGLLAVMLETATPRQKRFLAKLVIAICVINVFIALVESVTQTMWFPLNLDPDNADALTYTTDDFRPNAFFNHPLTASLITSMAVFLLLGMRLRMLWSAPIFGILLVGLFAYGGRTALAVTLGMVIASATWTFFTGIIRRNLRLEFLVTFIAGIILIPLLVLFIVTQTNISGRIMDTLYFDGSAQVRVTQWSVFKLLSLKDWLFGISRENVDILKYQIGLGGKQVDIENFWALMLLNLGAIGFAAFVVVFGAFLWHVGRASKSAYGWLLVIAALVIDTSSNSLGVKSVDLFMETAFLIALSGYADYRVVQPVRAWRLRSAGPRQAISGFAPMIRNQGLRILRPSSQ
jgi:hypothetical protein